MDLTGTAGRALGRRIGAVREKERAAANDNRQPPEVARVEGGEQAPALARGNHGSVALGRETQRDSDEANAGPDRKHKNRPQHHWTS